MSSLNVFFEQIKVGVLSLNDELTYSFHYSEEWLQYPENFALSLAMPLQKEVFGNRLTLSFFENLLPEGSAREAVEKSHQIAGPFQLLKDFGEDCAGAILISSQKTSPYNSRLPTKTKKIDMDKIYRAIENHQSVAHIIANQEPGYLSLAGAQDKFPAIYNQKEFFLPLHGAPTTHIVKVPINRRGIKESVFNEYYCMQLAALCGFNIPANQIVYQKNKHPLFVIQRYDRHRATDGRIYRIHQQDFCQAQGFPSQKKYEATGGPTLKDNYDLIVKNVTIKERLKSAYSYLDWICFNLFIGNNDSHSKNISFVLRDKSVELAPFYDLISTAPYSVLKKQFSFKIGGCDDWSLIGKKQFETLDMELGIKVGTMEDRMQQTYQTLSLNKDSLAEDISFKFKDVKVVKRIAKLIEERAKGFMRQGVRL